MKNGVMMKGSGSKMEHPTCPHVTRLDQQAALMTPFDGNQNDTEQRLWTSICKHLGGDCSKQILLENERERETVSSKGLEWHSWSHYVRWVIRF
jgi:hypothetical protein